MGSINRAELIGTLGKDPEIKVFDNENMAARFTMATNEPGYTLRNGTQVPEQTEWHNIICYGGAATIASKFLRRGSQVYVSGKLRTRKYTSRQDNIERTFTEIVVDNICLLGKKEQGQPVATNTQQSPQQPQPAPSTSQQPTVQKPIAQAAAMQDPRIQQVAQQLQLTTEGDLPF